jgi:hypothetical protein
MVLASKQLQIDFLALERLQVPQYQLLGSKTSSTELPGRVVLETMIPATEP